LERAILQAIRSREDVHAALVLLDADDDCPMALGPQLLARARNATQLPVAVVLAQKEYECWLLGAKESLRGTRGIRDDCVSPAAPEAIRDGKGHLSRNMLAGRTYLPVDDQAALTAVMDITSAASSCPSFNKLLHDLFRLAKDICHNQLGHSSP